MKTIWAFLILIFGDTNCINMSNKYLENKYLNIRKFKNQNLNVPALLKAIKRHTWVITLLDTTSDARPLSVKNAGTNFITTIFFH